MQNIDVYSVVTKHWLTVSKVGASMLNNGLKKHLLIIFVFISTD